MAKININGVLLLLVISLSSCGDIFEEQIDDETITVLAPPDNYETADYTVTFWWEDLDAALLYRVQIVHPRFDSVAVLVLDSAVTDNKLIVTLDPGEYQWRIRGENGSSETGYTVRNLTVFNSSLDEQEINVIYPRSTTWFSSSNVSFRWGRMPGSTGYLIEIDTTDGDFTEPVFTETLAESLSSTIILEKDLSELLTSGGSFKWRVKAYNSSSETPFTTPESFFISSAAPVLLLPEPGFEVTGQEAELSWEELPGAISFEIDVQNSDGTSLSGFPTSDVADYFFHVSRTPGIDTLFWKVSALDSEGNRSPFSEERMFVFK